MKNLKKILFTIMPLMAILVIASCKKDSSTDTPTDNSGKNVKFTITISDLVLSSSQINYVSFNFVGAASDRSTSIWKVNGVVQNNTTLVSLGKNDFAGTTKIYVIESTKPLQLVEASMQCLSPGANTFHVNYKAEVNGAVVRDDKDFNVTSTSDYTYKFTY